MNYNQNLSEGSKISTFPRASQELAERLIKNAWGKKRLASSYLFFGPPGTGKLSLARNIAKTVNCQAGSFVPCLVCSSCVKIENNNHPDVHYIQKQNSSFIKIEQIYQLRRAINLHPFEGKYKVFIILNVEDLTPEAANALLKILEEPPGDCLIILTTTDLRRIFSTIISRCQKIRFNPLPRREAEIILNRDYHLDKDFSHFLAFVFEGRLGDALKFKDRNILKEKNQIIRYFIPGLFNAPPFAARTPSKMGDGFDVKDKEKLVWIIRILISCIRDIYLLKAGVGNEELINTDFRDGLFSLAGKFSFADLDRMLVELSNSLEGIRRNINPRLLVDNLQLLWSK